MKNSGFSSVLMLVVAVVILIVTFVIYYGSQSGTQYSDIFDRGRSVQTQPEASTGPETFEENVSDMDDEDTLDAELEATVVSNPQEDFEEIEDQASQL